MEGKTPITLAGKEHALFFDVNAVAELEDQYDLEASVSACIAEGRFSHGLIRALLAAGLSHDGRRVSKQGAGRLIQDHLDSGGSLADIAGGLVDAITASGIYGKPEKNADAPGAASAPAQAPSADVAA